MRRLVSDHAILLAVYETWNQEGVGATTREVAEAVGLRSSGGMERRLKFLVASGSLEQGRRRGTGYFPVGRRWEPVS